MKVLYLSPYFWPEEIGSAAYSTVLAKRLVASGNGVQVVSFRPHYPDPNAFLDWQSGDRDQEAYQGAKIQRVAVNARGDGGFRTRLMNDLRFFKAVVSMGVKGQFKGTRKIVAYVPSVLTAYAARFVSCLTGAKIVLIVHDIESGLAESLSIAKSRWLIRIMKSVERVGFNFADQVIVLTEAMKNEIVAIGCEKPISVLSIWGQVGPEVPISVEGPQVVTYSGNFGKKQNIAQLFPLIRKLNNEAKDVKVVLRGGGSERAHVEEELGKLGLVNVEFQELVPSEQLMSTMQAANIHLVPQAMNVANYALPSKLFSIMSSGRPFVCIAEKGSTLDKLVEMSKAGVCVYPENIDDLFREVTDLLGDRERQRKLGENGRMFVMQNMEEHAILSKYETIINAIDK